MSDRISTIPRDRSNKFLFYVDALQAHYGVCHDSNTVENMRHIVSRIPPEKYNNILDIGVANGLETKILKDFGYSPIGVIRGHDNKQWALEHYPDVKFVDCDMHDLPFASNTFDAIYTNQVYEHTFAPFIFLLECWCVLKEGGLFYICIPGFTERHTKNDPNTMESFWISHHHPSLFPDNVNKQLFEKAGFEIVEEVLSSGVYLLKKSQISALHPDIQSTVKRRSEVFRGLSL